MTHGVSGRNGGVGVGGKHVETARGGNEKRMIKRWTDLEK